MVPQNSALEDRMNHLDRVLTISVWLGGSQQYEQPGKQLRVKTKVWGLMVGRETDDSTWAAGGPLKSRIHSG